MITLRPVSLGDVPATGELIVGMSIPVPADGAAALAQIRRAAGDRLAGRILPHVTLVPPTGIAVEDAAELFAHLERVAASTDPFTIHLSGAGTFRPTSPVVFVALARGIGPCERLQRDLRRPPFERPLSFPYHPHVTVAHGVDDDALDGAFDQARGFDFTFDVTGFSVCCPSEHGYWSVYREFNFGQ